MCKTQLLNTPPNLNVLEDIDAMHYFAGMPTKVLCKPFVFYSMKCFLLALLFSAEVALYLQL